MPAPTKQTKRRFGLLDFIRILLVLVILCALGVIAYRLWDYKTGTDRYDQLQQRCSLWRKHRKKALFRWTSILTR